MNGYLLDTNLLIALLWPDELPFAEAVAFAGDRRLGHQQVTDAYPDQRRLGPAGADDHVPAAKVSSEASSWVIGRGLETAETR